jgi:hypothetical protein
MKKTGWYSGDQKPVRVGLYEVQLRPEYFGYKFWSGKAWGAFAFEKEYAAAWKHIVEGQQEINWRGLTQEAK